MREAFRNKGADVSNYMEIDWKQIKRLENSGIDSAVFSFHGKDAEVKKVFPVHRLPFSCNFAMMTANERALSEPLVIGILIAIRLEALDPEKWYRRISGRCFFGACIKRKNM